MFNSWDRRKLVESCFSSSFPEVNHSRVLTQRCALSTAEPIVHHDALGALAIDPATHQIRNNFIFNRNWLGSTNSGYSIDWDDGSSQVRQIRIYPSLETAYHQLYLLGSHSHSRYLGTCSTMRLAIFSCTEGLRCAMASIEVF